MYQQYDKGVRTVLDYLVERGFSKTTRKDFRRAIREFREHLEEGRLEYSHTLAQSRINVLKPSLPRVKFLSYRRSLALLDNAPRNGSATNLRFSYDDTPYKCRVSGCYKLLLDSYIERRRQDDNQSPMLRMDSIACAWFLMLLQSKSITNVNFVALEIIKEYHMQVEHRIAEGKKAYIRRIRGFVRFPAMKRLVQKHLSLRFRQKRQAEYPSLPPCPRNRSIPNK